MNAVEIEQAITDLAEQPFDRAGFPYAFLEAFGNKATTIKRLRAGASNKSDLGGVLQTSNIHILTCDAGRVTQTLAALKASPATAKAKAKFILATDGADFEAEDLTSGETVACAFKDFPDHFGFFLPLAGISTVRQISENAFDIRATSRLNRLYVELLIREMYHGEKHTLILPGVSSERREYLSVGLIDNHSVVSNLAFALYDAPLWNLALIASRLHLVWIATVCGKLKTRYRYSNTLGWNTFPVPTLTEKNKADLTRCAENILLAREHHFPATIADLYDPKNMPADLRVAHERNDEVLERIYIGRRFRNDTERLEKLFDLYTKMTTQ